VILAADTEAGSGFAFYKWIHMVQFESVDASRAEFRGTSALAAVAALLGVAFGLSTLITPLYIIYQQSFGFSQITLTLVYAAYAIAGLATVALVFGLAYRR
jgi:hypothetical protein